MRIGRSWVRVRSIVHYIGYIALLPIGLTATHAADLDSAWLAGKWEATIPSPGGAAYGYDTSRLNIKPDGSFEEDYHSARGGRLYMAGKWKISGDSVVLEGTIQGGPAGVHATKRTITLKRSGDALR
jgi:hypothetical protein